MDFILLLTLSLTPKKVKWISLLFPTKIHSYYFHSKDFENNSSDMRCTGSLGRSIYDTLA
jgi:L-lysine 2,3-aminomutase